MHRDRVKRLGGHEKMIQTQGRWRAWLASGGLGVLLWAWVMVTALNLPGSPALAGSGWQAGKSAPVMQAYAQNHLRQGGPPLGVLGGGDDDDDGDDDGPI